MEMNSYALEMLAEDRLRRARQEAAAWALASRAAGRRRAALRIRVGLLVIRAGSWLRWSGVAGGSLGPNVA